MALQFKSITGSTNHSYWTFAIDVTENSTNINNNTSSVTVEAFIGRTGTSSYMTGASINCTINVTGCSPQTISGTYSTGNIGAGGWYSLGSKTFTVPHNSDGSKTVTISSSFTNDVSPSSGSASGSMTLTKIPRAATLTGADNFTDEGNPVIKYSNPAGKAATVQACITDTNGDVQYVKYRTISSTGTSYTFNLTDAERQTLIDAIPEGKSQVYVRFYIKTIVNGSTVSSPKYLQRILSITNAEPELSTSIKDIGSYSTELTKDELTMIKGFNHILASMSYNLKKGATILKQSITNESNTFNADSGEFPLTESNKFIFSITDSFGQTVTEEAYIYMVEYVKLTCNLTASNPTADGDMLFKISGNYFNDAFGQNGVTNTLTTQWRIKENDGEYGEWIPVTPTITDNAYEITVNLTGLNYKSVYTIQAMSTDLINTSGALSVERVVRAIPVYNWGSNNFDINVPLTVDNISCNNIFTGGLEQGSYDSDTGGLQENATSYRNIDPVEVEPQTPYITYVNGSVQKFVVLFYDAENVFISETRDVQKDGVFITPTGTKYINFRCYQSDYVEDFTSLDVQIFKVTPNKIKNKTINGSNIYGSGNVEVGPAPCFAQMNTNGSMTCKNGIETKVNVWSTSGYNVGDFVCQPANNRILIPKGSAQYVRVFGTIAGANYLTAYLILTKASDSSNRFETFNHQPGGNNYFKMPAFNRVYKLDTSSDYYLSLSISGYNGKDFLLNSGYGSTATFIGVEKLSGPNSSVIS